MLLAGSSCCSRSAPLEGRENIVLQGMAWSVLGKDLEISCALKGSCFNIQEVFSKYWHKWKIKAFWKSTLLWRASCACTRQWPGRVTTPGCKEFSSTETFFMSLKKPTHFLLLYLFRLCFWVHVFAYQHWGFGAILPDSSSLWDLRCLICKFREYLASLHSSDFIFLLFQRLLSNASLCYC